MKINSKGYIEPAVGEVFKNTIGHNVKVMCVKTPNNVLTCKDCFYIKHSCVFGCSSDERDDNNNVVFTKVD